MHSAQRYCGILRYVDVGLGGSYCALWQIQLKKVYRTCFWIKRQPPFASQQANSVSRSV